MGELRLHITLVDARCHEAAHPLEPCFRDGAGVADEVDLQGILHHPERVEQRCHSTEIVQRISGTQIADKTHIPRLDLHHGPLVLIGVEPDRLGLAHQPMENPGKVRHPMHRSNAGDLHGLGLRQLVPLPDGDDFARLAQEQHLPHALVLGRREEHQDGLFLFDAAQVEQVGVGHHPECTVGIGGKNVIRIENDHGPRREQRAKSLSVLGKQGERDRSVSHGLQILPAGGLVNPRMLPFPSSG